MLDMPGNKKVVPKSMHHASRIIFSIIILPLNYGIVVEKA
jgi:hypothetical protein